MQNYTYFRLIKIVKSRIYNLPIDLHCIFNKVNYLNFGQQRLTYWG